VRLHPYPSHFAHPSNFQSHSKGIFSLETVARNVHSMQRSPTRADKKNGGNKIMAKKLKKSKKLEATKPLTVAIGRGPARG
jgi:hypothetical protein